MGGAKASTWGRPELLGPPTLHADESAIDGGVVLGADGTPSGLGPPFAERAAVLMRAPTCGMAPPPWLGTTRLIRRRPVYQCRYCLKWPAPTVGSPPSTLCLCYVLELGFFDFCGIGSEIMAQQLSVGSGCVGPPRTAAECSTHTQR